MAKKKNTPNSLVTSGEYSGLLTSLSDLLENARRMSARTVNAILTATYWEIGRRIVEFEQGGESRADYGDAVIAQLSLDLTSRFGRGFGPVNLSQMRKFYRHWPQSKIFQTLSEKSQTLPGKSEADPKSQSPSGISAPKTISQTLSAESEILHTSSEKSETTSRKSSLTQLATVFPLPWSHYVRLLSISSPEARRFYESEAVRGGWSVRQLDRQIATQFYERTALSKNKEAMLKKGQNPQAGEVLTPEQEIKDPYVLEFLGLRDEYSENDLEEALILHLERFLMELGGDFAFIGRQKRLRIGSEWYRVDLLFFHRKLKCLVVIDLKVGKFTHADAGQMHLYLNYAREHWVNNGENPPVGLILCAEKDSAVAKYALEGLPNKVLAAEYKLTLPDEKRLVQELEETRNKLVSERAR